MNRLFQKDPFLPSLSDPSVFGGQGRRKEWQIAGLLVLAALAVRILYLLPCIATPEVYLRTDSMTYLLPARSILKDFSYSIDGVPTMHRTPLYPLFLAGCLGISGGSLGFCAVMSAIVSALTVIPLYFSARIFLDRKWAMTASVPFLLHLTGIAVTPMFISDTLFVFLTTWSMYFFLSFAGSHKLFLLLSSVMTAALAALTRPLNLFWIFPCLFVVACLPGLSRKKKFLYSLYSLLLFTAVLIPWIARNAYHGAGWRIDAVSADTSMHNRSVYESLHTDIPAYRLREQYLADAEKEYAANPEKYRSLSSRLSYHEGKLAETIRKDPAGYFRLHFRPVVLIPDAASFFENTGLTKTGRNTWDIINRKGLPTGIKHYFEGKLYLPFLLVPLLCIAGAILIFGFAGVIYALWKKAFLTFLLFLLFCEYFLFMTGPVAMPRYQMPAIPFLCILAAGFCSCLTE